MTIVFLFAPCPVLPNDCISGLVQLQAATKLTYHLQDQDRLFHALSIQGRQHPLVAEFQMSYLRAQKLRSPAKMPSEKTGVSRWLLVNRQLKLLHKCPRCTNTVYGSRETDGLE